MFEIKPSSTFLLKKRCLFIVLLVALFVILVDVGITALLLYYINVSKVSIFSNEQYAHNYYRNLSMPHYKVLLKHKYFFLLAIHWWNQVEFWADAYKRAAICRQKFSCRKNSCLQQQLAFFESRSHIHRITQWH